YTVVLDDYHIKAELTATDRVGFHRYTIEPGGAVNFLVDLIHRDPVMEGFIHVVGDRRVEGFRRAKFWAGDQFHYFAMEFSQPIVGAKIFNHGAEVPGAKRVDSNALQAWIRFDVRPGEQLEANAAHTAGSAEGAWKKLE